MNPGQKRLINGVCYATLGLLGAYLSVYQSVVGDIAADFALTPGQTGLMISLHFLGAFLFSIVLGEVGDQIGTRPVLRLSFLILVAGLTAIAAGRVPLLFLIGTLLVGGGFAVIEGLMTGLLTVANPERINSVMNLSQMYFCLGAVCGPFLVFALKQVGQGWRISYILLLVLFVICLFLVGRLRLPTYHTASIKGLYLKRLLRDSRFIVLLLAILLYVGVEEGTAFWVSSYVQMTVISGVPYLFFLSAYWLGMALGRWLFSHLKTHWSRWLNIGLFGSCLFLGLFLIQNQAGWILLWLFLVGFGFAPAWPVLMMYAAQRGVGSTNTAMGMMMAAGTAGGMVVPLLLGQVADRTGLVTAMLVLPVLLLLLIGLVIKAGGSVSNKAPE
jgi:fucose permease